MEELVFRLSHIRVDVGNVSGSISELMRYAIFAGFNDTGEEQSKPRLVGTWTVNDWYTQEQLAAAQAAFDGLTIVPDPDWLINFDNLAVQVLDSTKSNYNPAVAIRMHAAGLGDVLDEPIVNGGGRWLISKRDAAALTTIEFNMMGQFNTAVVEDTNKIVSDTGDTYNIENFDEFIYFTGVTVIPGNMFRNAHNTTNIVLPESTTTISTGLAYSRWNYDPTLIITIPANVVNIGVLIGWNPNNGRTAAPYIIHFERKTPITIPSNGFHSSASNYKIYVGDGSSAANDDAILQAYLADSNWNTNYSSILDTWYNYLHPTT